MVKFPHCPSPSPRQPMRFLEPSSNIGSRVDIGVKFRLFTNITSPPPSVHGSRRYVTYSLCQWNMSGEFPGHFMGKNKISYCFWEGKNEVKPLSSLSLSVSQFPSLLAVGGRSLLALRGWAVIVRCFAAAEMNHWPWEEAENVQNCAWWSNLQTLYEIFSIFEESLSWVIYVS